MAISFDVLLLNSVLLILLYVISFLQDETRKKATSTYLLENSDIPPPRYQKDTGMPSFLIPNNAGEFVGVLFSFFEEEFRSSLFLILLRE